MPAHPPPHPGPAASLPDDRIAAGIRLGGIGLLLAIGGINPAAAHDWWLSTASGQTTLQQGHRPASNAGEAAASTHSGPAHIDYPASLVREARCIRAGTGTTNTNRLLPIDGTTPWQTAERCDALLIRISSGYWSKTAWETLNRPKTGLNGVLRSWQSLESVKALMRWNTATQSAQTSALDLTPQHNPFLLHPGDKLLLRATLDGVPQAGVAVAYDGAVRGSSDAEGLIRIRIRHPGPQWLSASLETPLNDGLADHRLLGTTLQFELPP